jgi:ABC-type phosphate transport system substrate-binding protein
MNAPTKHATAILLCLIWVFLIAAGVLSAQSTRGGPDIAVVVHPETPVSSLTLPEVRQVLLGERQYWSSKLPVVLLIRAPVAHERDVVLRVIYQMTEAQFKQYWVAKIFRAEAASPPKIVYSNDMQYELVSGIPGAIAFMDARNVRPGLKILRVDGHLPGDKDYPLR